MRTGKRRSEHSCVRRFRATPPPVPRSSTPGSTRPVDAARARRGRRGAALPRARPRALRRDGSRARRSGCRVPRARRRRACRRALPGAGGAGAGGRGRASRRGEVAAPGRADALGLCATPGRAASTRGRGSSRCAGPTGTTRRGSPTCCSPGRADGESASARCCRCRRARGWVGEMPRYASRIEYDGGPPFVGWQWQDAHPSVQGALQAAVARIAPEAPSVVGAGRTDAGSMPRGKSRMSTWPVAWEPYRLAGALNAHLRPRLVAVVAAAEVGEGFHARFDAVEREYVFRLVARGRRSCTTAVGPGGSGMRSTFRRCARRRRPWSGGTLHHLRWSICQARSPVPRWIRGDRGGRRCHPGASIVRVRARSFLHNQVRGIVGTLERVGAGASQPERVGAALAARDAPPAARSARPTGCISSRSATRWIRSRRADAGRR